MLMRTRPHVTVMEHVGILGEEYDGRVLQIVGASGPAPLASTGVVHFVYPDGGAGIVVKGAGRGDGQTDHVRNKMGAVIGAAILRRIAVIAYIADIGADQRLQCEVVG